MSHPLCDCKSTTKQYIRVHAVAGMTTVYNFIGCSQCGLPVDLDSPISHEVANDRIGTEVQPEEHSIFKKPQVHTKREREFLGVDPTWKE